MMSVGWAMNRLRQAGDLIHDGTTAVPQYLRDVGSVLTASDNQSLVWHEHFMIVDTLNYFVHLPAACFAAL